MAQLIINENTYANGKVSFSRQANDERTGFAINGVLATHLYYGDITSIETPRYLLSGVEVIQEEFGSDSYDIHYTFTAKRLDVLGYEEDDITYTLLQEEQENIERVMYENDHPVLGDIGKEYKGFYIEPQEEDEESSNE